MGATVAVSSKLTSTGVPTLLSDPGIGVASIFVTALLVYVLAYLNVVENSERDRRSVQSLLVAVSIPLFSAFAGILAYESLVVIGLL